MTGTTRSEERAAWIREQGAEPAIVDVYDEPALTEAVVRAKPDVVVHQLTDIPQAINIKRYAEDMAGNNRIRIEGTRNLVDAALGAGTRTFIYPGICFIYADGGSEWIDAERGRIEAGGLLGSTLEAEAQVRRFTEAGRRGIVLRRGYFYGPEAESTFDTLALARRGAAIVAGPGEAFYPSIWVDDAASAVVAALRTAPAGIYDVVDDEPVPRRELARAIAGAAGRPFVLRPPAWLLKLAGGREAGFMVRSQRVSNARFKAATGWSPAVRDAREGWHRVGRLLRQPLSHG